MRNVCVCVCKTTDSANAYTTRDNWQQTGGKNCSAVSIVAAASAGHLSCDFRRTQAYFLIETINNIAAHRAVFEIRLLILCLHPKSVN